MTASLFLHMNDDRDDDLGEFGGEAPLAVPAGRALPVRDVLVFELDGDRWAIEAHRVDSVVAWRPPAPIPEGGELLAGVVQDAGRIIAVVHDPLGRGPKERREPPRRIVVCSTDRGLVGLPATATFGIESVVVPAGANQPIESAQGPALALDPEDVARAMVGRGARN